jgi:hypothetical protein
MERGGRSLGAAPGVDPSREMDLALCATKLSPSLRGRAARRASDCGAADAHAGRRPRRCRVRGHVAWLRLYEPSGFGGDIISVGGMGGPGEERF